MSAQLPTAHAPSGNNDNLAGHENTMHLWAVFPQGFFQLKRVIKVPFSFLVTECVLGQPEGSPPPGRDVVLQPEAAESRRSRNEREKNPPC